MTTKEAEILTEIRDSEKESEDIVEKAKKEKEEIIAKAIRNSSDLLTNKTEEIRKLQEKKIMDFRDKSKSIKNKKLEEGKKIAKQISNKAQKNFSNALEFVMRKFEEMI